MGRPFIDINNQRFDNVVVAGIDRENSIKGKDLLWKCICDCGSEFSRTSSDLKRGRSICPVCREEDLKEGPYRSIFYNYKKHSEKVGRVFELDFEFFKELLTSDCYYCGRPPLQVFNKGPQHKHSAHYNGIDRQNSKVGYVVENVVSCCKFCNLAKRNMPVQDLEEWLKFVRNTKKDLQVSRDSVEDFSIRIVVAGSRSFNDYDLFKSSIDDYLLTRFKDKKVLFISGGARRGADEMIIHYCVENRLPYALYEADWSRFGKSAGYIRNVEMCDACTDVVVFWDCVSKGTKHMMDIANRGSRHLTTFIVEKDEGC